MRHKMSNVRGVVYQPTPDSRGFHLILKILFGAFAACGAVFLLVGIFWLQSDREFYAAAQTAQGEIVDFVSETDGNQHPIVQYSVDGRTYKVRLNSYSTSMKKGDTYTMYFSPDTPHQARVRSYLGGTVFLSVGGGFFLFGAIGLSVAAYRIGNRRRLLEKGERVSAKITAVTRLDNVRVNGVVPYRIFCETGAIPALAGQTLKSPMIYRELPQSLIGMRVQVYVEPKRHKRYLVDADSLQIPVQSAEM